MIRTEIVEINNVTFIHTYSDSGVHIMRDGVTYGEAYDPEQYAAQRTYTETDIPLVPETEDEQYAQAGRILLGVDDDE